MFIYSSGIACLLVSIYIIKLLKQKNLNVAIKLLISTFIAMSIAILGTFLQYTNQSLNLIYRKELLLISSIILTIVYAKIKH